MDINKLKLETERLVKIMETLRGPDGCPWDRKQDYYSLKPYILEEAYEVVEALDEDDLDSVKEELGDLLLQVVFQAQIGREKDDFDLVDIFSTISNKLVRRHPHVFSDRNVSTVSEVMETWEEIKKGENNKSRDSILDNISKRQPALNQSYDMQKKAAEVGFDWDNVEDVVLKVEEEIEEVKEAIKNNDKKEIHDELGDLLFATVNLARFYKVNPELALLTSINKFRERFKYIEKMVCKEKKKLEEMTLQELDQLWEESKIAKLKED